MKEKDLRVKDIGEFSLIERLVEVLGPTARGAGQGVIRGIGDDAAVLQNNPGTRILASSDMLLEGRHFDLSYCKPRQLGRKALAVNLSDIAAMGGRPRWALVNLGLRPELKVNLVEEIYAGIAELAAEYGVIIVGGDTCSSEQLIIDICILGEAYRSEIVYRSEAREHDLILVTGSLGKSAAGLAYLRGKMQLQLDTDAGGELLDAHLQPVPRVHEASLLIRSGMVNAMNDISDGLASELHEIVQASGCGARIWTERLPLSPSTVQMATYAGADPLEWALYGGEDYELLLTIPGSKGAPLKARRLSNSLKKATGTSLSFIGRILSFPGVELVYPDGKIEPLAQGGYNHFKSSTT